MSNAPSHSGEVTIVMDAAAVEAALQRMSREIVEACPDIEAVALLGILKRGRPIAERLAALVTGLAGRAPRIGSLATTLYRDDLRTGRAVTETSGHETHFDFDVDGITVILVDDVLSTGRTVRAALDEVMDYGRPRSVQLACLVDRGLRELPIQPDYCGWSLVTAPADHVSVRLKETDGEDAVLLERAVSPEPEGDQP